MREPVDQKKFMALKAGKSGARVGKLILFRLCCYRTEAHAHYKKAD